MLFEGLTSNARNMPINSAQIEEGQFCIRAPICVLLCDSIKVAPIETSTKFSFNVWPECEDGVKTFKLPSV